MLASLSQPTISQRFIKYSFLLAILLHLLLYLGIVVRWVPVKQQENNHTPDYVPAYTATNYTPAYHAAPASQSTPQESKVEPQTKPTKSEAPSKTQDTEVSKTARDAFLNASNWYPPKTSILKASKQIIQDSETQETIADLKNVEPMLMIGDSSQASDPIVQILGRALSAHFHYPKMEDAFRVSGRVVISMVLHPEGNFTNVRILESSNNQAFDNAALYAVNSAPRAVGAERFLKEPKYFVVGFLFGRDPRFQ